jgi:hypothetical protein
MENNNNELNDIDFAQYYGSQLRYNKISSDTMNKVKKVISDSICIRKKIIEIFNKINIGDINDELFLQKEKKLHELTFKTKRNIQALLNTHVI